MRLQLLASTQSCEQTFSIIIMLMAMIMIVIREEVKKRKFGNLSLGRTPTHPLVKTK